MPASPSQRCAAVAPGIGPVDHEGAAAERSAAARGSRKRRWVDQIEGAAKGRRSAPDSCASPESTPQDDLDSAQNGVELRRWKAARVVT
jgi:hypothetical protein